MANMPIEGFDPPVHFGDAPQIPVYVSEAGETPIVVLHELPGMSPSFIAYCRRMADEGFKVHMPLFFKQPGTNMNLFGSLAFCLTREFRTLFSAPEKGAERPFTRWLLDYLARVGDENPGKPIGVVGMCLTGGFAIAGIAEPRVGAAAACQPSFPFFTGFETLGLSQSLRDRIAARAANEPLPCVKAYRYEKDWRCKEKHMAGTKAILGDAVERFPDLPGGGHSTLTGYTASDAVYRDVVHFFNDRLRAPVA